MTQVTRTLKKGDDTGRVNREEVRAVTIAIREGRSAEVLSGQVLREVRERVKIKQGKTPQA